LAFGAWRTKRAPIPYLLIEGAGARSLDALLARRNYLIEPFIVRGVSIRWKDPYQAIDRRFLLKQ
jgi:hypothetical protein